MATIQKYIQEHGCSRAEAFTLLRDQRNAERGIMSISYPSPESPEPPREPMMPFDVHNRVVAALADHLKPHLSHEDIERAITRAVEGK